MENLKSFVDSDPFSSMTQYSNLNYYSNLLNEIPPFDIDDLEIDWTDFDPIPFGIPSPESNPLPVRPVEVLQFDPTRNMVFETSSPQPSPSRNQVNIENDSYRLTPFVNPRPDISLAPCVAMPPQPPPSPPRDQTMNCENGFNPSSLVIPYHEPNPILEIQAEMPRFDPAENMVFERPWSIAMPSTSSPPCNQTVNGENGFNPTSLVIPYHEPNPILEIQAEMPRFDLAENMVFERPWLIAMSSTSSPPYNQTVNGENGFNPTSLVIPYHEPNPILEIQGEMPRFDPAENMVFERPIAMPSTSSPPRNQTVNGEDGFNPTSFIIPCPDPNPTPGRQVEMSARFDPIENMVIENPWNAIMQPSSPSPPCNQTMNLENNLNPTPFFIPVLDSNQDLVRPVEMHQFNPIENMMFENQWIATSSPSSPNTENFNFRPFGKTNADIICENYLEAHRNGAAAFSNLSNFNDTNGLFFSSGSEMQYFPAAAASSSFTEFSPSCAYEVEAATHGGADSSTFKRKWSVQEHMLLLVGMEIFGRGDWTNIADKVVITKSNTQVSSHAQKYFLRLTLPRQTKEKKRASIHDITTVDPDLLSKVRGRLGLSPSPLPVNKQTISVTDHR